MSNLIPRAIVEELDKYIIGQGEAKRAIAVALCNRERRKKLPAELANEVMPKNILMVGPTGVGKTAIAYRIAAMIDAPFLKVEATRFTEVGYVGRDVETIIPELVEASISQVYHQKLSEVESNAQKLATERILNCLCKQLGQRGRRLAAKSQQSLAATPPATKQRSQIGSQGASAAARRRQFAELLRNHQLEDQFIEIEVGGDRQEIGSPVEIYLGMESEEENNFPEEFAENFRHYVGPRRKRKVTVKEARHILVREEADKLLDFDQLAEQAVEQAEENGVIFLDEIDKLVGPKMELGKDVSGEGVQYDLLPIVEGTTVISRHNPVKTNHILFIAAGTFSRCKPADLIPEFLGRFPWRVTLSLLGQQDLERILVEPHNALTKQYQALLATEGMTVTFSEDGIKEIARLASLMNTQMEDIGARRLYTIMEKVMEELNFTAPERCGEKVVVDAAYVSCQVGNLIEDKGLSRYIL